MKPKLLFLTNLENDGIGEDLLLIERLKRDFEFTICHPRECLRHLKDAQGIVIRNIWPTHEYQSEWEHVKQQLRIARIPIYNALGFRGDIEGKSYLLDLYLDGYPVIPSIDKIEDLFWIPESDYYWVKPKYSCDGIGGQKLNRETLIRLNPQNDIIQPFIEFDYEPSFFFVDNEFHHAIACRHRLYDEEIRNYRASAEDIAFAKRFVQWAGLPHGIQRIDAVRTRDGQLFLTEIENLCPYLYLREVTVCIQERFVEAFRFSLTRVLRRHGKDVDSPAPVEVSD